MPFTEAGTNPASLQWIVFDYGEVISRRSMAFPRLATLIGAEVPALREAYRQERDAYVLGRSDVAYWQAVGARLGVPVDESLARELTHEDVRGWLDVDQAAVELADDLRESGMHLALLSNLPGSLARAVERQPWTSGEIRSACNSSTSTA